MGQLGRKHFLIAAGTLLAAPLAPAQPKVMRLGLLTNSLPLRPGVMDPFLAGLHERG